MRIIWLPVVCLLSCAHSAVIQSEPAGAHVYRNDERVGSTPYEFNYRGGQGGFDVRLEKEGYTPLHKRLDRKEFDNEYSVGALIVGGSLLTLGVVTSIASSTPLPYYATSTAVGVIGTSFIFQKFEDEYSFTLKPAPAGATAPANLTSPTSPTAPTAP